MLILHTHWQAPRLPAETGAVLFWAETNEAPSPTWQRGRIAANPKPKDHPFCAPFSALELILGRKGGNESAITLRLPTTRTGPLPSSGLIHNWELDTDTSPSLAPWVMTGLCLPPVEALPLLVNLPELDAEDTLFVLGTDTLFWSSAAALALETLAAQKLIPILVPADLAGQTFHARWLPILDAPKDSQRLARLEAAMPPVCRAAVTTSTAAPLSPRTLLTSFLNLTCDAFARQAGRAAAPRFSRHDDAPVYRWLEALFDDNPIVKTSPAQLQALANSHRLWLRNLNVAGDDAFRIAFRLEAPAQQTQTAV